MKNREELMEFTVYGMIEGEQTFLQALKEAAEYLEMETVAFDGRFQREVCEKVNQWFKENN